MIQFFFTQLNMQRSVWLTAFVLMIQIAQAQNIGIGTSNPVARLHVADSNVLFTGPNNVVNTTSANPPAQGPGARMMWYPQKAAFRAGLAFGFQWDKDSMGIMSVGLGNSTKAMGESSFASGAGTKASGDRSTAMGEATTASGFASFAVGSSSIAAGRNAIAMGLGNVASNDYTVALGTSNIASGFASFAFGQMAKSTANTSIAMGISANAGGFSSIALGQMADATAQGAVAIGSNTRATGVYTLAGGFQSHAMADMAVALGNEVRARSYGSMAVGSLNDTSDLFTPGFSQPTDRLFQIGNGTVLGRSNAMTVLRNGNIGLGNVVNPTAPLQFPNTSASKKLVFWQSAVSPPFFAGIGNTNGSMTYQTSDVNNDHVFASMGGTGLYEVMRIRGLGKVGIMVNNPQSTLEVAGRIRLQGNTFDGGTPGIWFRNAANTADAALISMVNDQAIGISSGTNAVRLLVNTANGNIGINNTNPVAPLTFANTYGDKIVLQDFGVTGQFALRTQEQLLQIATPTINESIALGYGTGAGFTDKVRIAPNGNVGIGTKTPIANLEVVSKSLWSQLTLASTNTPGFGKIDFVSDYGQVNQWRQAYIISNDAGNFTGSLDFYTNGVGPENKNGSRMALQLRNGAALTSTGSVGVFSDERLKQNIVPFTDGLNVIQQINPVQFQYTSNAPFASSNQQVGIIAQELEKAAPYMVHQTTQGQVNDLRWVDNQAYIFLLINAVKTLESQNTQLQKQITELAKKLDTLSKK